MLDRLIEDEPVIQTGQAGGVMRSDELSTLRQAVHRDLEALLNAHRPWASVPAGLEALTWSVLRYGVPNFTSGALNLRDEREALRHEIERTIRRFETRLAQVNVRLTDEPDRLRSTLRMRIEAVLKVEPVVAPIAFDTTVNAATAEMVLQLHGGG